MPSETRLNQLVKGAPTNSVPTPPPAPLPQLTDEKQSSTSSPDVANLPSSPPQIYLNLLILESSLRAQYLDLLSRRRLNTFFITVLSIWNFFFIYALFLRPREDGTGFGGSVYWVVEVTEKLALMGGLVTTLLIWATGQWERGVRWPRRWLGATNRGMRGFNLRVVVIRRQWWRELLSYLSFLLPLSVLFSDQAGPFGEWHLVEHETGIIIEEDLAKGGDHILLLLLPKAFSPEFRENWEEYRSEYWSRENERRAILRKKLKKQRRDKARDNGGWKWWTGIWRLSSHRGHRRSQDLEKHPAGHHHLHPHHAAARLGGAAAEKDPAKTNRRRSLRSESNHSRGSSRSSTPVLADFDGMNERFPGERVRRGSSVSSTASVRRKRADVKSGLSMTSAGGGAGGGVSDGQNPPRRKKTVDRPRTPDSGDDSGVGGGDAIKKEDDSGSP